MRRHLSAILVFAAILGALIFIEARPQFPDPDSFYHAKMALIIRDQGFIHTFPWLEYTVLAESYVDYHLGYHVLLIPFVTLFDPLVGMKVSAVIFGLAAFYALYRFLKAMTVPHPELFVALAGLSTSFLHRMSLPRAPSLSVAFLLLVTWALIKQNRLLIFASSALYVWFYYGWPLLVLVAFALIVAEFATAHLLKEKRRPFLPSALVLLGGIAAGLVINPYFPANVIATARDVYKLAIVNYHSVIPVGMEWYPSSPGDILASNPFLIVALALGAALILPAAATTKVSPSREKIFTLFSCVLLASGFFLLTLKSNRFIEYAIPFVTLTTGGLFIYSYPLLRAEIIPGIVTWFKRSWPRKLLIAPIIAGLLLFVSGEIQQTLPSKDRFTAEQYKPATDWIRAHSETGALVFHNAWDYSLVLFYLDDTLHYLVGLDPTYMYSAYREEYDLWYGLISGTDSDVKKIIDVFGARSVVIDTRIQSAFEENLRASGLFEQVVDTTAVHVYAVK